MGLEIFKQDIANILGETVRHEPLKVAEWLFEYAGGLAKEDPKQLYF